MPSKTEIKKAAEAHKALLDEKITALKVLADKLGTATDVVEMNKIVSAINDISWKIGETADVVAVSKRDTAAIEKAHAAATALTEKLDSGEAVTAEMLAEVKALGATVTAIAKAEPPVEPDPAPPAPAKWPADLSTLVKKD